MSLVAGGKGTCYIARKVWQCSPVVTWKIGCVPNKCDDVAKEISRQRVVEGSAWILPVAYKKMQLERDELKINFLFFK